MSDNEEVPYIFVPKRDQQAKKNNSSAINSLNPYKMHDLILIYGTNHEYLVKSFKSDEGEMLSPVFQIIEKQHHQLILRIMEVKYPISLFHSDCEINNILNAIHDGMAVVVTTEHIVNIRLSHINKVKTVELMEIEHISPLIAYCPKSICPPMETIDGRMKCNNPNHGNLSFFITGEPLYGTLLLNNKTGEWEYTNTIGSTITDAFFITIWDHRGAWLEQKVIVQIKDIVDNFQMKEQEIKKSKPGIYYGDTFNISHLKELGAFVENRGSSLIEVEIECSPNAKLFIKEALTRQIGPGQTIFLTPVYYTPYVRLRFKTEDHLYLYIWYYGYREN